jgi:vanillate O-demethylase ferredoxin subunit
MDLHLPGGLVRQYSLCSDPADTQTYRLGVLKDPASRGGSVAVHAALQGARLTISAPRNHFPLDERAPHSVLVGGGIGITPMLAMAHRLPRWAPPSSCTTAPAAGPAAFLDELAQAPGPTWSRCTSTRPARPTSWCRRGAEGRPGRQPPVCLRPGGLHGLGDGRGRVGRPAARRSTAELHSAPVVAPTARTRPSTWWPSAAARPCMWPPPRAC